MNVRDQLDDAVHQIDYFLDSLRDKMTNEEMFGDEEVSSKRLVMRIDIDDFEALITRLEVCSASYHAYYDSDQPCPG